MEDKELLKVVENVRHLEKDLGVTFDWNLFIEDLKNEYNK